MKQLHHSGLPLYLDDDGVMVLKPPLNYLGFGRKKRRADGGGLTGVHRSAA